MSTYKPKRLKGSIRRSKIIKIMITIVLTVVLMLMIGARCSHNTAEDVDIQATKPISARLSVPESTSTPKPVITPEPTPEQTPTQTPEPIYYYTPDEVDIVAKILYREARGISSDTEVACVAWVICNRVDAGYGDTIEDVATAQNQFAWVYDTPLKDRFINIAYDVLNRWSAERQYGVCDGRVLPAEYLFFHGDGVSNYFRTQYEKDGSYYTYWLDSPYES